MASTDASAAPSPALAAAATGIGPVMVMVHDLARGDISILIGTNEIKIHDRDMCSRIVRSISQNS